eukprot:94095-Hanusia_phi.AAC.1
MHRPSLLDSSSCFTLFCFNGGVCDEGPSPPILPVGTSASLVASSLVDEGNAAQQIQHRTGGALDR